MSNWPSFLPAPDATALLQLRGPNDEALFGLGDPGWPSLHIPALLPLHVVKVVAVGLHRDEADLSDRDKADPDFFYHCPGFEFAGYVVSTSPNSPLPPGTEVYGRTSFHRAGNARTYTVAKFHELAPKPKSLTFAQAASVPVGALAAYQALFSYPLLREPGPRDWGARAFAAAARGNGARSLLVTGAGTPVGAWAVQLARLAGVREIVATCDEGSRRVVEGLGAGRVYDWMGGMGSLRRGWEEEGGEGGFDVVLDCVGGGTLERAWGLVAEGGRIISVAGDAAAARPEEGVREGVVGYRFRLENCPKQLGSVAALADRGGDRGVKAVCEPQDVFLVSDFDRAMERLRKHPRGQVVIQMEVSPEVPVDVIKTVETHGEAWETVNDFGTSRMQMARREDPGEEFGLAQWLRTQGSNHPDAGGEEAK